MDCEPSTSMEADKNIQHSSMLKNQYKGGGTTCCIPTCSSNTKRNPELSYYKIPNDKKLRRMWLHWIGRANFKPKNYHKVCSKHFIGGKKTCLHNTPTLVEKLLLPTQTKPRTTYKCRNRNSTIVESQQIDEPVPEDNDLEQIVEDLKEANEKQQSDIAMLNKKVKECSFSVQQFKSNDSDFEFYTGFCDYGTFQAFYDYLRSIPIWPSQEFVRATMPQSFKNTYPHTRVIIDCTELFIETPSQPRTQSATFSTYKNHNTGKGLIGISPRGDLTFVSEMYAGNTSDKQLTNDCGIMKLLEPGDEVMADRGFEIEENLPPGVSLNIPPFLGDQQQFSEEDEIKTRRIAKQRIHVERAIQRIKSFRILKHDLPISMAADLNKIWVICSYLTLFFRPLIQEHEE